MISMTYEAKKKRIPHPLFLLSFLHKGAFFMLANCPALKGKPNVLNNPYALSQLESHLALGGLQYENETIFTKAQVSEVLDIDERTIERYLKQFAGELKGNGYRILKGKTLKGIKLAYVDDIIDPKAPSLGVFTFRAILNLAILVTESERAKAIRGRMLDIVLDVVAQKAGGHTKYINLPFSRLARSDLGCRRLGKSIGCALCVRTVAGFR